MRFSPKRRYNFYSMGMLATKLSPRVTGMEPSTQAKFHRYIPSRCRTVKATTDAARGASPDRRLRTQIAEGGHLATEGGRRAALGGAPAAVGELQAAEGGLLALGRRSS